MTDGHEHAAGPLSDPDGTVDSPGELSILPATAYPSTETAAALERPDWPALPGYSIHREIARGGMGRVLAGRELALDREVAIKTLLPEADPQRFVTESKITARLPHPGIPPVYALGQFDDGSHFLAMKLIRGRTLHEFLRERQTSSEGLSRWEQVFEQIAQAVGFAHAQGIIHRDLKPLNVMIGTFGEVQVMDWGLAKDLASREHERLEEGATSATEHTQAGHIMGTPSYMAPEQARGETVDARADVFALGAILTTILTGQAAFVGASARATAALAAAAELTDAHARLASCGADPELIALAKSCLAAKAKDRPANARVVAEQMAAYRAGVEARLRQAETETAAVSARAMEERKRRRQMAWAAGVIATVLVIGIFGTSLGMMAANSANADLKISNDKERALAGRNAVLAKNADERRVKAEQLALRLRFEQAYLEEKQNNAGGILLGALVLEEAEKEGDAALEDALRLHLGHWARRASRLRAIIPRPTTIKQVALSADAQRLAILENDLGASGNGQISVWDPVVGKQLLDGMTHEEARSLAFSPDGKFLLTESDKSIRVWNASTGTILTNLSEHGKNLRWACFSADGKAVLACVEGDYVGSWEPVTGKRLSSPLPPQKAQPEVWRSPDRKKILTRFSADVHLRDLSTGTSESLPNPVEHGVHFVAFSPTGKTLLVCDGKGTTQLVDATTGKALAPASSILRQEGTQNALLSPDGKFLVTTESLGHTATFWDAVSGRLLAPPVYHDRVNQAAFSPSTRMVFLAGLNGTIRPWDAATGKALSNSWHHPSSITALVISSDAKSVVSGGFERTVRLWEPPSLETLPRSLGQPELVYNVAYSPDGKTLFVWTQRGAQFCNASGHARTAAVSEADWKWIDSAAFSPDGNLLLSVLQFDRIQIWDVAAGKLLPLAFHKQAMIVRAAVFAEDSRKILAADADGRIFHWDVATGECGTHSSRRLKSVRAAAFGPGGKVVVLTDDQTMEIADAATGETMACWDWPPGYGRRISRIAISNDCKTVVSGSYDQTAGIWDAATGKPLGAPVQHQSRVQAVAFSPDGKCILTLSDDRSAHLWDARTGKALISPLQSHAMQAAFSPDGQTVVTGGKNGAWLHTLPRPLRGTPKQIRVWIEVITGMELAETGAVRFLEPEVWNRRRQQLEELGGAPSQ